MDFIIIANAWSAAKDNPTSKHRIALELARRGHHVLWIEGSGMRAPSLGSGTDRLRMVKKVAASLRGARRAAMEGGQRSDGRGPKSEAPWILSPFFIPLPRYGMIRRLNGFMCRLHMRFWGWRLGFVDPVLINYVPVLAEAMRGWRHASATPGPTSRAPRVVYHCVDRWDAFRMYDSALMAELDRRCCLDADLVIASSTELHERCRTLNSSTVLITHGVDYAHFHQVLGEGGEVEEGRRAVEAELAACGVPPGAPVAGFFGLLSEWVDQDLLVSLAGARPEAQFVLIGTADVPVTRLQRMKNIHLLGPRPFRELPQYIARFDVGMIPFVVNDLTRSVNPIKLREMLSAGCPVVSTALPEVEKYAGAAGGQTRGPGSGPGVSVARDADEFVRLIQAALTQPLSREQRRAIGDSMRGETWAGKVEEILKLLEQPAAGKRDEE